MASTFSTNLAIELIGTGDQAGTWGTTTNSNLGTLIEQAISGYVTQAVVTGTDTTITIPNGATGVARNMYIELTGTGGTNTNLIVPANKKLYFIFNNSTGAVTVKVSGQTGVSVPTGKKMVLVSNGTDIVNGLNYIADFGTNSFSVTNLTASSGTITNLIATSGSITNLVSSDASATVLRAGSATLTHLSATSASITNLSLTSLTISSLSITNVSVASATVSSNLTLSGGNLAFTSTAQRLTADMSNGTVSNRFAFQTSTTNGNTQVNAIPNGTSTASQFIAYNSSDPNNASSIQLAALSTTIRLLAGQTGTGAYLPITFFTNAAEQMRLDTSGNLGIGTASPLSRLNVAGTTGLTWVGPGDSSALVTIGTQGTAGGSLFVNTASLNSSFASGLAIDGTYSSFSSVVNIKALGVKSGGGYGSSIAFHTSSNTALNEQMRLDSSGNLGIGTASPAARLHLSATEAVIRMTATSGRIWDVISGGGGNVGANFFAIRDTTSGANVVQIAPQASEALRIDASGNVGIGTASPASRLDVTGAFGTSTTAFTITNTSAASASNIARIDFRLANSFLGNGPCAAVWGANPNAASNNGGALVFGVSANGTSTTPSEVARFDQAGNLGLGVTPSAWGSGSKAVELPSGISLSSLSGYSIIYNNSFHNGTNYIYKANGTAAMYQIGAGTHAWFTAASGTANNAITFTAAMTLSAAGGLSVGTTGDAGAGNITALNDFRLAANSYSRVADLDTGGGFAGGYNLYIDGTTVKHDSTGAISGYHYQSGGVVSFFTGGSAAAGTTATERARITAAGDMGVGTASPSSRFHAQGGAAAEITTTQNTNASTPYGHFVYFSAAAPNNATQWFIKCQDSAAERATIRSNGGLANYSANDVNLASDERLKKDISPLNTAWDKVKNIEVVNYRYKDCNEGDPLLYGVIAQQVQPIVPELVVVTREATETDPEYYGIREQPMYWLAIKALQEAMTKIEKLEAEVAALKGA